MPATVVGNCRNEISIFSEEFNIGFYEEKPMGEIGAKSKTYAVGAQPLQLAM